MELELDHEQATRQFYQLVWPQRAAVLRAARLLSRNPVDAEDLAQETLLKAFRKINSFSEGGDMKAWLLTILRNTWIDRHRLASAKQPVVRLQDLPIQPAAPASSVSAELPSGECDPQEVLNAFSDQEIIDVLQRLPDDVRWTLLLVDVEGMAQTQAAEVLDVAVGTIKSRTSRGHAALREELLSLARERRIVRD